MGEWDSGGSSGLYLPSSFDSLWTSEGEWYPSNHPSFASAVRLSRERRSRSGGLVSSRVSELEDKVVGHGRHSSIDNETDSWARNKKKNNSIANSVKDRRTAPSLEVGVDVLE